MAVNRPKRPGDLAPFLEPDPSAGLDVIQGVVTAYNPETGENTVELAGGRTETNLPVIGTPAIVAGAVVSLLRQRTRYFILGMISTSTVNISGLSAEGSYTPTITVAGGGSVTLITQRGRWWRVGRQVTASVGISSSTFSGTNWALSLPFLADTTFHTPGFPASNSDCIGSYWSYSFGNTSQNTAGAVLLSSASLFYFLPHGSGTLIGSANFTTSALIKAQIHYVADPAEFVS